MSIYCAAQGPGRSSGGGRGASMRRDGKRVKNISAFGRIIPHIMPARHDSQNFFRADIDAAPIDAFINRWRKEGIQISRMELILAAYLRLVSQNPALNRFVVGRTIYARNHFTVSFVLLKGKDSEREQTVVKIPMDVGMSVFEVAEQVNKAILENRDKANSNSMDRLLDNLTRIPGLLTFLVAVLKGMDRIGILPRAIIDASPFHTSLFLSNLASIRTNYIYHHLYNFGTTSEFITMGKHVKSLELVRGEVVEKKLYPLAIVTDERICSGDYYANCFRQLESILKHPEQLEKRAEKVLKDE